MVRSFIADNIDINKSTVSKETTINFFQLLNWGLYLMPLSAARMSSDFLNPALALLG
jgi:hypothetical protein